MLPLDLDAAPRGPLREPWPDPEPWDRVAVLLDDRATWAVMLIDQPSGQRWVLDHAVYGPITRGRVARC